MLKQKITKEYLIDKLGEENIFRYYFGDFVIGRSYKSIFTKDERPSTGFYVNSKGSLIYNDLRTGEKLDCIAFVAKLLKIKYGEAISQIAIDFGIKHGATSKEAKPIINKIKKYEKKEKSVFSVKTKPFTKADYTFWLQFGITKKELERYNIYSVSWFKMGEFQLFVEEPDLCFAYLIPGLNGERYFKIYTPTDPDRKWFTNAPLDCVYGLENLTCTSNKLIITKSLKDYIVLRKFYKEVIYVQNESKASLPDKIIRVLLKCGYKLIYIFFDCDRPGIRAANYYKKKYGFIPTFITEGNTIWECLKNSSAKGIKDPSDYAKYYDLHKLEQHLKTIINA